MEPASPADRLVAARRKSGFSPADVAARVGLPEPWYRDLEADSDELFSNVSLARLQVLCNTVAIEPLTLLTNQTPVAEERRVGFGQLVDLLNHWREASGDSVDALSVEVGWNLKDLLIDSEELWNFTVDGLRDVCQVVGVDWQAALPDSGIIDG
jgi:transcriptional regulator with XRE-family HTH domain